jgi:bis(5'-nucleosyl)-tetraphosphatase (symmetrical)
VPDYAIGDVQGCFTPLQRLLEKLEFNERSDRLWFVGDLVNRGPHSLEVLRFVKNLPVPPKVTLGNHDLHLLSRLFTDHNWQNHDDTLQEILMAPDAEELGDWLRHQSILVHDPDLNIALCHAGIAPVWSFSQAQALASELEQALHGDNYRHFLKHMYGNEPDHWQPSLEGMDRLRVICNYYTRMRFCTREGHLVHSYKGTLQQAPAHLYPWYAVPNRLEIPVDIVFGHWAALQGKCPDPHIHAIDTGCLWGGELTALRLQDRQRFSVPGS